MQKLVFGILNTLVCLSMSSAQAETRHINTGKIPEAQEYSVTINTDKAYPSYTIAPVAESQTVDLLDQHGTVVHRWPVHAVRARLTKACSILVLHNSDLKTTPESKLKRVFREYAWDGSVMREYRDDEKIHHDVNQLPNGHVVFPVMEHIKVSVTSDEEQRKVRSDKILELDKDAKVVWEWKLQDYFPLDGCGRRTCRKPLENTQWIKTERDWSHINTVFPLPENHLFDSRFRPGNLLGLPRNFWMFFIVDRKTGEIVWEYTGRGRGDLMAPHEANMIPKGMPGAGNIIFFDNGTKKKRDHSIVQELDPKTKEIVWEYKDPSFFFSEAKGSGQRLPNGNTFISSGTQNVFFEVTADKNIVWKLETSKPLNRARKYAHDHCPQLAALHKQRSSGNEETP